MVSGLVEQQDIWRLPTQHGEHDARLLAIRKGGDLCSLHVPLQAKHAKVASPDLNSVLCLGVGFLKELQGRELGVQDLGAVLVVAAEGQVAVVANVTLGGGQVPSHKLEKGGLADSIGAHESDTGVAVDPKLKVLKEVVLLLAAVGEADVAEGDYRRRQLGALGELEGQRLLPQVGPINLLRGDLVQHLLLGRRTLSCFLIGLIDCHKLGELSDIGLLFLV
mmetsp:Transcript_11929/g.33600  ORF Transcript_11929/g.33600 Transcript_11929/m.33600 type:complete len:221 (+) Transcript_11929:409-1071(+)